MTGGTSATGHDVAVDRKLDERGTWDPLAPGTLPRSTSTQRSPLVVQDERRDPDRGEDIADVDLGCSSDRALRARPGLALWRTHPRQRGDFLRRSPSAFRSAPAPRRAPTGRPSAFSAISRCASASRRPPRVVRRPQLSAPSRRRERAPARARGTWPRRARSSATPSDDAHERRALASPPRPSPRARRPSASRASGRRRPGRTCPVPRLSKWISERTTRAARGTRACPAPPTPSSTFETAAAERRRRRTGRRRRTW